MPPDIEGISSAERRLVMPLFKEAAREYAALISLGNTPITSQERSLYESAAIGKLLELDRIRRSPRTRSGLQPGNFRGLHGSDTATWFEAQYKAITEMTPEKTQLASVNAYFGLTDLLADAATHYTNRKKFNAGCGISINHESDVEFVASAALEQVYYAFKNPNRIINPDADKRFHMTALEQVRLEHGGELLEYLTILRGLEPQIKDIEDRTINIIRYSTMKQRREITKGVQKKIKGMRDDQQVRILTLQGLPESKAGEFKKRLQESGMNFAKISVVLEGLGYTAAGIGGVLPVLGNITENSAHIGLGISYGLYYTMMGLVGFQNARMSDLELSSLNPATQAMVEAMKRNPDSKKWQRLVTGILSNYGSEGLLDFLWAGFAGANPTSTINGNMVGVLGAIGQVIYAEKKLREAKRTSFTNK